jgi:hypothetical protein
MIDRILESKLFQILFQGGLAAIPIAFIAFCIWKSATELPAPDPWDAIEMQVDNIDLHQSANDVRSDLDKVKESIEDLKPAAPDPDDQYPEYPGD